MKILHVIPTLDLRLGGSVIACADLCRELASRGEQVSICSTIETRERDGYRCAIGDEDNVRVINVPVRSRVYGLSIKLVGELSRAIRDADVVHIHGLYRFPVIAASYLCWRYGIPYIVKPHGSLDPYVFRVKRWRKWLPEKVLVAPCLARADAIQFTAEDEMILAAESGLFKAGRGKPVFNAAMITEGVTADSLSESATADEFVESFPETKGKDIVLFLSRINYKKGLDILARAFGVVRKHRNNAHLVIAGPDNEGYKRQVLEWLREAGVEQHTTFTGMLVGTLKSSAYKAAAVFALPSYTENFGLVIGEAMTFGVPVVISNKVNIWREIEAASAGLIVNCNDGETASAIEKLLADKELRMEIGQRGKRLVKEQFSWTAAADQALDVYRSILKNHRNTGTQVPVESCTAANPAIPPSDAY